MAVFYVDLLMTEQSNPMSPTLLEIVVVMVLVIVGWQIGVGLAPLIWRRWQRAKAQLDHIDQRVNAAAGQTARKESNHERATGIQSATDADEQ